MKTQVIKAATRTDNLNGLLKKLHSPFNSFPQRKPGAQMALLVNSPKRLNRLF